MPDRSARIALAPLATALAFVPFLVLGGLAAPSRALAACVDADDPTCFVIEQSIDLLASIGLLPFREDGGSRGGARPARLPLLRFHVDMESSEEGGALALGAVIVGCH